MAPFLIALLGLLMTAGAWLLGGLGPLEARGGDLALLLSGVDLSRTRKREWYERAA